MQRVLDSTQCKRQNTLLYTIYLALHGILDSTRYTWPASCCLEGDTGIKFIGLASLNILDSTRNWEPRLITSKN